MTTPKTLNIRDSQLLMEALLCKNAPHKTFLKGVRNYLLGSLMLDAGLRVGELVQLQMSDLYFNGNPVTSIVVREAITKSKEERSVPVNISLACALEEFHKEFDYQDRYIHAFAFPASGNTRDHVTTRQVERIINKAGWKALGRPVNPHMLRHTFATRINKVTDMRTLQVLLGHQHLSSTQIYTHPDEEDKKKAIQQSEITNRPPSGVPTDSP